MHLYASDCRPAKARGCSGHDARRLLLRNDTFHLARSLNENASWSSRRPHSTVMPVAVNPIRHQETILGAIHLPTNAREAFALCRRTRSVALLTATRSIASTSKTRAPARTTPHVECHLGTASDSARCASELTLAEQRERCRLPRSSTTIRSSCSWRPRSRSESRAAGRTNRAARSCIDELKRVDPLLAFADRRSQPTDPL